MAGCQFCAAINCRNSRKKKPNLSFFRFPKDKERCKKWVQNSRRVDLSGKTSDILYKSFGLCAEHFEDNQFMNSDRNKLIWKAIPTKFDVPNPPPKISSKRAPPKSRYESPQKLSKQNDGIKPHECNNSGKSFTQTDSLKNHIRSDGNAQILLDSEENPSDSVKSFEDSHEMNQDLVSYPKIFVKEESNLSSNKDSEDELMLPREDQVKQTLNIPVDGQVKEEQDSSFDNEGKLLHGVKIEEDSYFKEELCGEIVYVKEELDLSYGEAESWDS